MIGAGFWGKAVSALARSCGIKVLTLDSGYKKSGSRNAAGLVHTSWFSGAFFKKLVPEWWTKKDLNFSLDWLQGEGLIKCGEDVEPFYGKNKGLKSFRPDCWMLKDLDAFLNCDAKRTEVLRLVRGRERGWIVETEASTHSTKRVVLATGIGTDDLLERSGLPKVGVSGLKGRGVILVTTASAGAMYLQHTSTKLERPYRMLKTPYLHYTFRPWGEGKVRLGDTVEGEGDKPSERREGLLSVAQDRDRLKSPEIVEWRVGFRPVSTQGRVYVELIAPGLVVATGGHRVGLGLSGGVALRVLKLLKVW